MKRKMELSIGAFVAVGLVLLAVMIINFRDKQYLGKQYFIYALFNYIGGVVEGAPVRYAGVDVGKVTKSEVFENDAGLTKVKLTLAIKEGIAIKKDSQAGINSLGIIGEKYVEISPGTSAAGVISPKETLIGTDPVAIEAVMVNAQKALKRLEESLTAVNNILTVDTQADVKATIVNFKNFGADVDRLTNKIEQVVDQINKGDGTLGKLIYAQELHDELLALIKGIREHGIFYKAKDSEDKVKSGKDDKSAKKQSFGSRK